MIEWAVIAVDGLLIRNWVIHFQRLGLNYEPISPTGKLFSLLHLIKKGECLFECLWEFGDDYPSLKIGNLSLSQIKQKLEWPDEDDDSKKAKQTRMQNTPAYEAKAEFMTACIEWIRKLPAEEIGEDIHIQIDRLNHKLESGWGWFLEYRKMGWKTWDFCDFLPKAFCNLLQINVDIYTVSWEDKPFTKKTSFVPLNSNGKFPTLSMIFGRTIDNESHYDHLRSIEFL
jgi:hypothetical protein